MDGVTGAARGLVDLLAAGASSSGDAAAGRTAGSHEPKSTVEQLAGAVDVVSSGGAAADEAREASDLAAELWEATEAAAEAQLPQGPSEPSTADPAAAGTLPYPAALLREEPWPADSQTLEPSEVEAVAEMGALMEAAESMAELAGEGTETLSAAAAGTLRGSSGTFERPGASPRRVAGPPSSEATGTSGPEAVAEPGALLEAAEGLGELQDEDETLDPAKAAPEPNALLDAAESLGDLQGTGGFLDAVALRTEEVATPKALTSGIDGVAGRAAGTPKPPEPSEASGSEAAAEPGALLDAAEGLVDLQDEDTTLDPAAVRVTEERERATEGWNSSAASAEVKKREAAARRLRLVTGAAGLPHPDKMDRGGEVRVCHRPSRS